MATLQATRQQSACTARARLKLLSRKPSFRPKGASPMLEPPPECPTLPPAQPETQPDPARLSVLELRQLLLQTAGIYPGWQLVSIQHRPMSEVLVASLVRSQECEDATRAIREGRVLQIIMDGAGDLRIHHPHRQQSGLLVAFFRWLATLLHPWGLPALAGAR